jgi:hypothetical protein
MVGGMAGGCGEAGVAVQKDGPLTVQKDGPFSTEGRAFNKTLNLTLESNPHKSLS